MKNLEVHNYGVATMSTREMRTTNGGGRYLWYGAMGQMKAMADFAIGFVEGFIDCNCE